jgi:hypothetical protein
MTQVKKIGFRESCPKINWEYLQVPFENNGGCEILIVKFSGVYECTYEQTYARIMPIIVRAGVEYWNPSKVIIDYSELEFNGGDEFEKTYDAVNNDYITTVIVVGDKCREAMSEIAWNGESRDIVDNSFFFEDIERAVSKLRSST